MKTAEICIPLFGKPAWEFEEKIDCKKIKAKGDELKARLYETANILEKLCNNGWDYELTLYDVLLTKNISKSAAEKEVKKLGLDLEVHEFKDEE